MNIGDWFDTVTAVEIGTRNAQKAKTASSASMERFQRDFDRKFDLLLAQVKENGEAEERDRAELLRRLEAMESRLSGMEERIAELEGRLSDSQERIADLEELI